MKIKSINEWNPHEKSEKEYVSIHLHKGEKGFDIRIIKEDYEQLKDIFDRNEINFSEDRWGEFDLPF